jgi:hypothetical protein
VAPNQGGDAAKPDSAGTGGDGGAAPKGDASQGRIGEACQTTSDCAQGLECVATSAGASVCDIASFGLTPSSKTCSGECGVAADCCELPPGLGVSGYADGGFIYAQNCQDILQVLLGGNQAAACSQPTTMSNACFFYQTYCQCGANAWACNAGRCNYTGSCSPGFGVNQLGGCPSLTRSGASLNATCNTSTASCGSSSPPCSTDAGCDGHPVVDRGGVTCRGGDCACLTGGCYLKCAKDLDCPNGYSCDASRNVCVPSGCSNDAQCFSQLGMARAKCNAGTCGIPCMVDLDCSPSGDIGGQVFNGTVCGPNGFCAPVGCTSDADCSRTGSAPRTFCVAPSVSTVRSAITN